MSKRMASSTIKKNNPTTKNNAIVGRLPLKPQLSEEVVIMKPVL